MKITNIVQSNKKHIAVVIKGNPIYLEKPSNVKVANSFYLHLGKLLRTLGYVVLYDEGKDKTIPKEGAEVWVAHSRGIGRLKYAPSKVKTVALECNSDNGDSPLHYQLSDKDIRTLQGLKL